MRLAKKLVEPPPPSTLDQHGRDPLLDRLIAEHHEPRFDIAPQLQTEARLRPRIYQAERREPCHVR